ncbi:MAG: hypothetical protein IT384_01900 [Deltaproteobacteria bacterium]|nr:hypothetical protein [Deltaproteobacteria bacterium]
MRGRVRALGLASMALASASGCAHQQATSSPDLVFDATAVADILLWARSDDLRLPTSWRTARAYELTRAWAEWSGLPDPDLDVLQVLTQMGANKATRGAHPLERLEAFLTALEARRRSFIAESTPILRAYLPSNTPIRGRVLFAVFIPPFAFAWGDGSVVINLSAAYFDFNDDKVFNLLIHELFHNGFGLHQRGASPMLAKDGAELIENILWQTQNEGIATYVAYRARSPGLFVEDYALIEDEVEVGQLFERTRALLDDATRAGARDLDALKERIFTLGSRDRAFYVVGAVMARQIETQHGRAALVETIVQGPRSFFRAYQGTRPRHALVAPGPIAQ